MNINRRDLLQGKLWKLIRPARAKPLVMRYPTTRDDLESDQPATTPPTSTRTSTRTIGGISIMPVAPTELNAVSTKKYTIPVFRPPGAIEEQQFLAGCTRCSDCADACPHDAIVKAPQRLTMLAGTPVIEADVAPCLMCPDMPCITACQPGVLVHSISKVMGTAQVTEHLCLAYHSTTCTVCSERCPVDGAIVVHEGRPTINEGTCSGCGVCRYVCPAPENAILLMPAFHRPPRPTS